MPAEKEFSAIIGMLTEGQAELRSDMKELTKSVNTLVQTQTEFIASQRHTEREIEDIKAELHNENGIESRITKVEIVLEGNRVRWAVLAIGITIMLGAAGGIYKMMVEPSLKASTSNVEAAEAIREQTEVNKAILKLLEPEGQ